MCIGRVQPIVATPACWSNCSCLLNTSAGVLQPSTLRGRLFSARATASRSLALHRDRSVPLGKYWRKTGARIKDGIGVCSGVGIYSHDILVLLCHGSHRGLLSLGEQLVLSVWEMSVARRISNESHEPVDPNRGRPSMKPSNRQTNVPAPTCGRVSNKTPPRRRSYFFESRSVRADRQSLSQSQTSHLY
ncbi:hypothetical protein IWX88_002700 [Frigoribacterium sp. CG_9.8]|nr:hypothetical protein [Frigoribacterium sp. CG_9.8]